jgi:hypothetical protein
VPWAKLDDAFTWDHKVVAVGNEGAGVFAAPSPIVPPN